MFDKKARKPIVRAPLPALASDYIILDLASKTWARPGSGNDAMWIPGRDAIVYSTPGGLVPLPPSNKYSVWSSQLVMYDFAARREIPLTSGLTTNRGPAIDYH